MSTFPRSDMPLLDLYKTSNNTGRKQILADSVGFIKQLPVLLENDAQATEIRNSMFEHFQLLNYVDYTQRVATQKFFDISFDASPLIKKYGSDNPYFECNTQGQMRLKKSRVEIPNEVWVEFRAAQQKLIEKAYQRLSSDLDIYNIFIPPKDAFPYTWHTAADKNQAYDAEQRQLSAFAEKVAESENMLRQEHIAAFRAATEELKLISYQKSSLKTLLQSINNQATNLAKTEPMDTLILAITQTIAMLKGELDVMQYEDLLNRMPGHATSSTDMQTLCNTLLALCALAISIGIVTAATSTVAASVAGASAIAFAAGAAYTFFAPGQVTETTGLSKAMVDVVNHRKTMREPVKIMRAEELLDPSAYRNC